MRTMHLQVYIAKIMFLHVLSMFSQNGAFGGVALHHATCLEYVPISYDQSLLKGIVAKHY
jgi:hypothetical protein